MGKKTYITYIIFLFVFICLAVSSSYAAVIDSIRLLDNGSKISIKMDGYPDFRAYQSDRHEAMIIFKKGELGDNISIDGSGGSIISRILFEKNAETDMSVITIQTKKEILNIDNFWNYNSNTLLVNLKVKEPPKAKSTPKKDNYSRKNYTDKKPVYGVKKDLKDTAATKSDTQKEEKQKPIQKIAENSDKGSESIKEEDLVDQVTKALDSTTPVSDDKIISDILEKFARESDYRGGLGTIIDNIVTDDCSDIPLKVASRLAKEGRWLDSLASVEGLLSGSPAAVCKDNLEFFRMFLMYKSMEANGDEVSFLAFKKEIENLLNRYDNSPFLSYGYAMAGLVNQQLNNYPYASGFYKIIEDQFPNYPGMAEVYYNLGKINFEKDDLRVADIYLSKLLETFPDTKYAEDAKLILGKIMYSKKRYFDTIKTLGSAAEKNERILYENPEILRFVAQSYFETGRNQKARELFARIFNIFPDAQEKDMILTSIGETFEEQGQKDKAEKIYRLVTQKFPGTKGFVKSSLKLADNMKDEEKREIIYQMIISDFPDSVEARIALMRLGELYLKQKKYDESIDSIKALLAENPRALRKDALFIMSQSLVGKVSKLIEEDNYASALRVVEKERFFIDDMKTFDIHFISGEVYLKTHMYKDAEKRLEKAQKLWVNGKLPMEVLKYRAIAGSELGEYQRAIDFSDEIIKDYKEVNSQAWALELKGDVYLKQNNYSKAESFYRKAGEKYDNDVLKGSAYKKLADLYNIQDKLESSKQAFMKSMSFYLASDKDKYVQDIAYTSSKLGEINLKLKDYNGAVSSFQTVLDSGGGNENLMEVRFNLAEALRGLGQTDRALEQYNRVVADQSQSTGLWKELAGQRIREIELKKELDNS